MTRTAQQIKEIALDTATRVYANSPNHKTPKDVVTTAKLYEEYLNGSEVAQNTLYAALKEGSLTDKIEKLLKADNYIIGNKHAGETSYVISFKDKAGSYQLSVLKV